MVSYTINYMGKMKMEAKPLPWSGNGVSGVKGVQSIYEV